MLGRFGRDAGSLLGVEIASDSVRILQLQGRHGRRSVGAWALEPFESPEGGWATRPDVVAGALRRAWHRSGSRQRQAAVALPASEVICKVCRLPAGLSESEMEAQLLVEAERLFPFPLQDLALDFQELEPAAGQAGEARVLVGACRQQSLAPLEEVLGSAGLQPVAVEVDSIALARTLPAGDGSPALLRIEPDCAVLHGWPEPGLPQRTTLRLLASEDRSLAAERVAQWLRSALSLALCKPLLVAADEGWVDALSEQLGMPCTVFQPFTRCEPSLVLALGLAMGDAR